jgi:glycosyltransferase involved in cell wall biosynthesis
MTGQGGEAGFGADLDVAITHDWLVGIAGGERVVQQMAALFPRATLYTLFDFLSPAERAEISHGHPVRVSRLNRLPGVRRYYRSLLIACTRAVEEFDLSRHDLVLSSSAALAKGVLTGPGQLHVAYVHSPARYAWDMSHDYIASLDSALKRHVARRVLHRFRLWDMRTPASVDHFIANSEFIRRRIWKVYRREAEVIHPPVDVARFTPGEGPRGGHYLTASRMVPYKRIPMIAAAFAQRPALRLRIVGDGPEMAAVRAAAGRNVEILGHLPQARMKQEMQAARAFVFAAREDFGIVPVEAQACGTPVIALGQGGTAETVRPLGMARPTGLWFHEQSVAGLVAALDRFEAEGAEIRPEDCRANALGFSAARFRRALAASLAARL